MTFFYANVGQSARALAGSTLTQHFGLVVYSVRRLETRRVPRQAIAASRALRFQTQRPGFRKKAFGLVQLLEHYIVDALGAHGGNADQRASPLEVRGLAFDES